MKKALEKHIKEFYHLFEELENDHFEILLKDIESYIDRFSSKDKKKLFLRYIQERIFHKPGGSIFISPDEIDHGGCYLAKFDDPQKIAWLFTYRIEKLIWELDYNPNYKEREFRFELKYEHRKNLTLEQIFEVLYYNEIIEDYQKSDFLKIFSGENIYQIDAAPLILSSKLFPIALIFEFVFRELFVHIDESKIFDSNLFKSNRNKIITGKSIQDARSKNKGKFTQEECLEFIRPIIDKLLPNKIR
jgi:hypothetical protein